MAHWLDRLRVLALAASMSTLGVGCQAIFGDFHVDDSAFPGGGTGSGDGGSDSTGGGASGNHPGGGNSPGGGASGTGGVVQPSDALVFLAPTDGLYTTEWGGQTTFSIVLQKKPTASVTVGLSTSLSDDTQTREGKLSLDSVMFTPDDWNAPQVVVITGVDDTAPDGNQLYHVVTAAAKSDDKTFDGYDAVDLNVVNIDNETAGITVAPTSGLVTSESGMQDTFTVVLNSKPTKDVTIALSSDTPTEGTVAPATLTFTDMNWMAPQLVTVTGVADPDHKKDGDIAYNIVTAASASKDPTYDKVDAADVSAVNLDNDSAGVTVNLVSGIDPLEPTKLRTSESGDTATFTVELRSQPGADVTIPISSSAVTEGTVSPAMLTFTKDNWRAPQTVTVMGIDDDHTADGNQPYNIVLGAAVSTDADYKGFDADDVPAINVDNDKPGFTLMLLSGIDGGSKLITTEAGTSATFSLALNSKPLKDVIIKLSSSIPTEGTVSPTTLTFNSLNWNAPQIVTVKGVDDAVQDGNVVFFVRTATAMSDDPGYVLDPPDVQVTNQDNDSAGVRITLVNGIDPTNPAKLVTGENGDSATFTIALTSQPTADVAIALVSSNTKEGTISPTSVKFTSTNYGAAQTITIKGVDDSVVDGNQPFIIAVGAGASKDTNFDQKFGTQVQVTNRDNDTAAIIVAPVSGLTTGENGQTATFTIVLQSQPTANVTIGLSSSAPTEGKPNVGSVTFTSVNWNAPQTVTVTGQQDDGVSDGNQPYKIITDPPQSTDPNYGPTKMNPADVSLTNLDDDSPGFIVTPTTGLITSEAGTSATFSVKLQSKPLAAVKFNLSSSRPAEGTVSPASLTFTDANWNSAQTVTVTGVNDDVQDGIQAYLIQSSAASSTDPKYNGLIPHDVSVSNLDNDTANIQISPTPSQTPAQTKEKAGTSTFNVRLTSQPTAGVTFTVTSSDLTEGTVSPGALSFTTANWASPQTVTVTGVNDDMADGDQPYKVQLSNATSTDANYSGKFGIDLPFINIDDDHPGYVINAAANLLTSEGGATATFTIALLSQPAATVSVPLVSSNTDEGTVTPAQLDFTTGNWATPQTVTVTGVQDLSQADGPQGYVIQVGNAVSTDTKYKGLFATTVSVTNQDDDAPGFAVLAGSNLHTSEQGGTATFTVALMSRPTGTNSVTLGLSSSNTKEGTVSPATLLFTTANWQTAQTVTVTGVNDAVPVADGNATYTVSFSPAVSGDTGYSGKSPQAINLINDDDDIASVLVTPTSCSTAPGATATFTMVLTSQPGDSVTIPLSSDTTTEGTVSPDSVTFTIGNWNVAQTVTVTGVDDGTMGAVTNYKIVTDKAVSVADTTGYKNYDPADVSCSNTTPQPPPMP